MKQIKTKVLWGCEENDLFYLGYLTSLFLDPWSQFSEEPTEQEVEDGTLFTKKLLLICSGLVPSDFFEVEDYIPKSLDEALADFIENFLLLYPHIEPYNTEADHWANINRRNKQLMGVFQ